MSLTIISGTSYTGQMVRMLLEHAANPVSAKYGLKCGVTLRISIE